MKRLIVILSALTMLSACSSDDTVAPPEPFNTSFSVDSLQIEVWRKQIPPNWLWTLVGASYWYEINDYRGSIWVHEFIISETDDTLYWYNNIIPDSCEPTNGLFYQSGGAEIAEDLFSDYDSLTVYFTLIGHFRLCCGGLDSMETIYWSDTVRVEVNSQ